MKDGVTQGPLCDLDLESLAVVSYSVARGQFSIQEVDIGEFTWFTFVPFGAHDVITP